MTKLIITSALICISSHAITAHAQDSVPVAELKSVVTQPVQTSSPVVILYQNPEENILRAGTEISLRLREELTTKKKKLRVG